MSISCFLVFLLVIYAHANDDFKNVTQLITEHVCDTKLRRNLTI